MIWIAPSEKDNNSAALEKRLWDAADQFRANSGLKSQEYSAPGPQRLSKPCRVHPYRDYKRRSRLNTLARSRQRD